MIKNTMVRVILMILIAGFVSLSIASSASAAGIPCPGEIVIDGRWGPPVILDLSVADTNSDPYYSISGTVIYKGKFEIETTSLPFGSFLSAVLGTDFSSWVGEDFYNAIIEGINLEFLGLSDLDEFYITQRVVSFERQANTVSFMVILVPADALCVD